MKTIAQSKEALESRRASTIARLRSITDDKLSSGDNGAGQAPGAFSGLSGLPGAVSRRPEAFGRAIQRTQDFERILGLPRRTLEDVEALSPALTDALRTPAGQMQLRVVQAEALLDLLRSKEEGGYRGLFCPARVGAGKTLISLLAPTVICANRPLLLIPAKLYQKTVRDATALANHWMLMRNIIVCTYEFLSRVGNRAFLDEYNPDIIVADEAHKLKNPAAAVTRRVYRYMENNPNTVFVALSGTITKRSIRDYAHILKWTHKDQRPVPLMRVEMEEWGLALDEKVTQRNDPGALLLFCNEEEQKIAKSDRVRAARLGFGRRLAETVGVVTTPHSDIGASISVDEIRVPDDTVVQAAFHSLRTEWIRPDGVDFADPMELYRIAKQLSLGFYYRWNPAPPEKWLSARREWNKFVRKVLSWNNPEFDSELQIRKGVMDNKLAGHDVLADWMEVAKIYEPVTECVWLSERTLDMAASWAEKEKGIVWVEYVEFGKRFEEKFRIPYYGRQGKSASRRFIDDHPKDSPMVAGIASNAEGRNLQAWNKNLITSVMPNALQWEQLMGRTHRDGQQADEVEFYLLVGCIENLVHFDQSVKDAQYQFTTLGQPQKLLLADRSVTTLAELEERGSLGEGGLTFYAGDDYRFAKIGSLTRK